MKDLVNCFIFLAAIGICSFFLGRSLPKLWFQYDRFPYRPFTFEQEGKLYTKIGVQKWKGQVPDMSVLLPKLIPSKRLPQVVTAAHIELMIAETCVAEWIHELLILLGFVCVLIWKGTGGWIISLLYGLGNLPYIIIQRYNRPKLVRLAQKLQAKEGSLQNEGQVSIYEQGIDFKLQYGRGA